MASVRNDQQWMGNLIVLEVKKDDEPSCPKDDTEKALAYKTKQP